MSLFHIIFAFILVREELMKDEMKKVISFCKYNPMQYVHLGDINSLKDF